MKPVRPGGSHGLPTPSLRIPLGMCRLGFNSVSVLTGRAPELGWVMVLRNNTYKNHAVNLLINKNTR